MSRQKPVIQYKPAQLHKGECWYIDYYFYHPIEEKFIRKKIKINWIGSIPERNKYAKKLILEINNKLYNGWNPLAEQDSSKVFKKLSQASEAFLRDKRNMRPDTIKNYKNFITLFTTFCQNHFGEDPYLINITKNTAIEFLEQVWLKGISAVRYNNYIGFQILFFNWIVDHGYTKVNPFKVIKKKRNENKNRVMDIEPRHRRRIYNYLKMHNRQYLLIVYLTFYSLLRPKEIAYLKKEDFHIKGQYIKLSGDFTKNGNDRIATIPDVMLDLTKEILEGCKKGEYIFSTNFLPGKKMIGRREIGRYWEGLRDIVNLEKEIQFYSLRDSGIIEKIRDGLDLITVMQLADHSSLEMTNVYAKIANNGASKEAMRKITKFSNY